MLADSRNSSHSCINSLITLYLYRDYKRLCYVALTHDEEGQTNNTIDEDEKHKRINIIHPLKKRDNYLRITHSSISECWKTNTKRYLLEGNHTDSTLSKASVVREGDLSLYLMSVALFSEYRAHIPGKT